MAQENTARKFEEYDGYSEASNDPRLVDTDFIQNQGLSAKATRFDIKNPRRATAANGPRRKVMQHMQAQMLTEHNALFEKMKRMGYAQELEFLQQQLLAFQQLGAKNAAKQLAGNFAQRMILLEISPWLTVISAKICFWQIIFGLISLAGIGVAGAIDGFAKTSWIGRSVNWVFSVFGTSIQQMVPVEYIGLGFWFFSTLVGMLGFIGFMLFFTIALRINLMKSTLSSGALFLCIALTIMPVGNIFPWLMLWVMLVVRSEVSFLGMALDHHKTHTQNSASSAAYLE